MSEKKRRGNPNIREIGVRFQPGQSGNPGGRPKGFSLVRLIREELQKNDPENSGLTNADAVAAKVVEMAKAGDHGMIALAIRYMDGDPKAAAELTLVELAQQLAERLGLDAEELMATFERDAGAA